MSKLKTLIKIITIKKYLGKINFKTRNRLTSKVPKNPKFKTLFGNSESQQGRNFFPRHITFPRYFRKIFTEI